MKKLFNNKIGLKQIFVSLKKEMSSLSFSRNPELKNSRLDPAVRRISAASSVLLNPTLQSEINEPTDSNVKENKVISSSSQPSSSRLLEQGREEEIRTESAIDQLNRIQDEFAPGTRLVGEERRGFNFKKGNKKEQVKNQTQLKRNCNELRNHFLQLMIQIRRLNFTKIGNSFGGPSHFDLYSPYLYCTACTT